MISSELENMHSCTLFPASEHENNGLMLIYKTLPGTGNDASL